MHARSLAALTLALPALALSAERQTTVSYPSGDERVQGYLALPSGDGPFPGLVLVHEWWGQNEWAREKARSFASKGYAVLAVDLYRGKVADDGDRDTAHQLSRGLPPDRAVRDLRAAFELLASRKDVDPKRIGVIGWCMGGGLALDLAQAEPRTRAVAVYYGRLPTDAEAIGRIKAPVVGSFGADDKGIPAESVEAFRKAAAKAGVQVDVKVYPGAGHAFASKPGAPAYVPAAAKDADERTDAFLARTLKGR
jgi:carboxymethylenebutenolidase